MCRTPCCPPQRSSGLGPLIAVIAVAIIAANVLRAIVSLLELLVMITVTTIAVTAITALVIWAIRHHRRQALTMTRTVIPARHTPAIPTRYVLTTGTKPPTALPCPARPAPALTRQQERAIRHFAAVITSDDDPAAVEALIRRALRGPNP